LSKDTCITPYTLSTLEKHVMKFSLGRPWRKFYNGDNSNKNKLSLDTFEGYKSWTSSKRPPKTQRLCGRLGRCLLMRIGTQEISSDKRSRHFSFLEKNVLCAISKLRIRACSSMLSLKFRRIRWLLSTYSNKRDHNNWSHHGQVAAYKQPRSQVLWDLPVSLRSDGVGENLKETRLAYK